MPSLQVNNEQLLDDLRRIADAENRSVEEILQAFVTSYHEHQQDKESHHTSADEERVQRLHRLAYERARRYWREAGDDERAALSDEELRERFWGFDENDIPRLKSEADEATRSPLSRLAARAREVDLQLGDDEAVSDRADEILRDEFADYLLDRMNRSRDETTS